ncbi:MAG: NAD(P)H-dependent oxidoreductase [Actinomycetota bacterium]|nr:NAD(P)H-dependent oxidoreductase [Actinomycetota bacterium]
MTSTHKELHVIGIGGTLRNGSTSLRALDEALRSAEEAGATTELLALRDLALPIYDPGKSLQEYGENVKGFVEAMRGADAMLWSTAAYHGTLAGVTKNALDFTQFMARDERPYLQDKVIGLIATAGGSMAGVNAINAMVNVVHALRGVAAPLSVPVAQSWKVFDEEGDIRNKEIAGRLQALGRLVVEMAEKLSAGVGEPAGRELETVA